MEALKELEGQINATPGFFSNAQCQAQLLQYFERIKSHPEGLSACAQALSTNSISDLQLRFLCLQIVEHGLKSPTWHTDPTSRTSLQNLMLYWLDNINLTEQPPYLRNKVAQIFSLVFISLFPDEWPTFFHEVFLNSLENNLENVNYIDFYLRTLLSIDSEVVVKEIQRTKEEEDRNTRIKDAMREKAIQDLVKSWHAILNLYSNGCGRVCSLCLNVIGAYVCWIDLMLIANDKFVPLIVHCLSQEDTNEAAGDCLCSIISKGMDPSANVDLISAMDSVLESTAYYNLDPEADSDLWMTMAQILNSIGVNLIDSYAKLQQADLRTKCVELVEKRLQLVLLCLRHENIDVSGCVTEFCHKYVTFLKQFKPLSAEKRKFMMDLLLVCFEKYKFPEDYNFAVEGENEAEFLEYRKEIRVILMNIGLLDRDEAVNICCELVLKTVHGWRVSNVADLELALNIVYVMGELFTTTQFAAGEKGTEKIKQLIAEIISCGISQHKHMAVMLQYFEVVSRYDKFVAQNSTLLPDVVASFLDDRGLHHTSGKVRSRVAYLFSRFVRGLKVNLQNYVGQMLMHLEDLLAVLPAGPGATPQLTPQDQLFLFEATGYLIVSANFPAEKKKEYMEKLLNSLSVRFEEGLRMLDQASNPEEKRILVEFVNNVMAYASRTTKAFSNQLSMKACMCSHVYVHLMLAFLNGINETRGDILDGLRQYLHRMVICLENELLPAIPVILTKFLGCVTDIKCLYDFLVLIQQIMQKHKSGCLEYIGPHFADLIRAQFAALSSPFDPADEVQSREHTYLRRAYCNFVLATINSQCLQLWSADATVFDQIVTSIVDVAYVPDPVCQKSCMSIVKQLAGLDGSEWIFDFLRNKGISVCILMPLQQNFDFDDAQTILALTEGITALRNTLALFVKKEKVMEFEAALCQVCEAAQIDANYRAQLISYLQIDNKTALTHTKLWFKEIVKNKQTR